MFTKLSALCAFALISYSTPHAATLTVCPVGCDNTTISDAVNAAVEGDTILVADGTYNEAVVLDKELIIACVNSGAGCTVDAGGSGWSFTLSAPQFEVNGYITLEGFTVTNGQGIIVFSSRNTVTGNVVNGGKIMLEYDANYNNIDGNEVSGGGSCIDLFAARVNTIEENIVNNCTIGISLDFDASGNTISGNEVSGNTSHGVYLFTIGGVTLDQNTISNNGGDGIHTEASSSFTLEGNTIEGNIGHGISMEGAEFCVIAGNTVTGNGGSGINLRNGYSQNSFTGNTIENNNVWGVHVESSNGNTFYNNYFDNGSNCWDDSTNDWNSTMTAGTNIIGGHYIGGNYWSDYSGADTDGDGLGETPYSIPGGNNNDMLPLVEENPQPPPDLVISDMWFETGHICYKLENIGEGTAGDVQTTSLEIDGVSMPSHFLPGYLYPATFMNLCFPFYGWVCSPLSDTLTACADANEEIDESDETNNCLTEEWECGPEVCDNGLDDDLDGSIDCADSDCSAEPHCLDSDSDGYPVSNDCDDSDPATYPGAEEICDGFDNDCNGLPDDLGEDPDDDLVGHFCDNCWGVYNPAPQSDSDGDCLVFGDHFFFDPHCGDRCDNCPFEFNPGQEDSETICRWSDIVGDWVCILAPDGVGDACDNCPMVSSSDQTDSDSDGLGVPCDNCPMFPTLDQTDSDSDGVGDACDTCRYFGAPDYGDADGDCSYFSMPYPADPHCGDICDNCPTVINPEQSDNETLAYWPLDEGSGFEVHDASRDNDFTHYDLEWTTGISGSGLEMPSWLGIRTDLWIDGGESSPGLTMEAWVYPEPLDFGLHSIMSGTIFWGIYYQDGEWGVHVSNLDEGRIPTGMAVDFDAWQHVAAVFMPHEGARFYKNGVEFLTPVIGHANVSNVIFLGEGAMQGAFGFRGILDEVAIFDTPLPREAIQAHYLDGLWGHGLSSLGDGQGDACDGCPAVWSPDPTDTDGDGTPDACDDDDDDDGCLDRYDDHPLVDHGDSDGDALPDDCDEDDDNDGCLDGLDSYPLAYSGDPDSDGVGSDCDNCPDIANVGATDRDGDGEGDACDCDDNYRGENERGADCEGICTELCPDSCLPYMITGDPDDKIDLVFVRDVDYIGNEDRFFEHVDDLITGEYGAVSPIDANMDKFNFHFMEAEGESGEGTGCGGDLPPEFDDPECDLANAVVILHWESFGDCTTGSFQFTAEGDNSSRSFIHESGHGIFKLKDEYEDSTAPCTSYAQNDTDGGPANIWSSESNCETDAVSEDWDSDDCREFCDNAVCCGTGWWKIDHDAPEIMEDNSNGFGIACSRRIDWILDQYPDDKGSSRASKIFQGEGEKTVKLFLHFLDDEITHLGTRIGYGTPRDYRVQGGDFFISVRDGEGALLYEFGIYDPREINAEAGSNHGGPVDDIDFGVVMPFFATMYQAEITDAAGVLMAAVDLTEDLYGFCSEHPDDPDCEGILSLAVGLDVKPGSYPNCVNINGRGLIPAAILGSADFDAGAIDISTLRLAGLEVRFKNNGTYQCAMEDVSGDFATPEGAPDGHADLVCHFVDDPELWAPEAESVTLTGELNDGRAIEGSDGICIVPARSSVKKTISTMPRGSAGRKD